MLEAGNLIPDMEEVTFDPKKLSKAIEFFKERYPTMKNVITKMLTGHKKIKHRPNFNQLLELFQNEGLMQQRLTNFKAVQ